VVLFSAVSVCDLMPVCLSGCLSTRWPLNHHEISTASFYSRMALRVRNWLLWGTRMVRNLLWCCRIMAPFWVCCCYCICLLYDHWKKSKSKYEIRYLQHFDFYFCINIFKYSFYNNIFTAENVRKLFLKNIKKAKTFLQEIKSKTFIKVY